MTSDDLPGGVTDQQVTRIMERVLQAEKEKLHMKIPQGINNEIESILEQEVD
jgi:hypothetical protein